MISPFLGVFDPGGLPCFKFLQGSEVYRSGDVIAAFSGFLANETELRRDHPDAPAGAAGLISHLHHHEKNWMNLIWGEYVAAIYDGRDKGLTLIRDRIGFYPLFVVRQREKTYFATSIHLLLSLPEIPRAPCHETLARFIGTHYRHVEGNRRTTAFAGVEQLPGGTLLRVTADGFHEESYWDERNIVEQSPYKDEQEAADSLRSLLADAVRRRSAGRMTQAGFALSSGMDSSSILALAASAENARPPIFTTSFAGWKDDEAIEAKETAAHFGTWNPIIIDTIPDFLEAATELQSVHDEPVVTVTWLWDYMMQKEVSRRGCRLFFGGLGGDELFAGEFEHFFFHFADLDEAGEQEALRHEIEEWVKLHDHPVHRKSRDLVEKIWSRMRDPGGRVRTDPERHGRYIPALSMEMRKAAGSAPVLDNPWVSYLKNRLWQDLRAETTLPCLRAATLNAGAHGMEIRFPFLDHRVVELAMPLPGPWKIRDGITKRVLRRAMRGVLPDNVLNRARKMGWASPADQMFRGAALDKLEAHLHSSEWMTKSLYDANVLARIAAEHRAGQADHSMFLWQFAAVEAWWRRWFG